ncbi:MAG: hypothetical protein WBA74_26780, partial [Cyclobacteriaceae bacterium]
MMYKANITREESDYQSDKEGGKSITSVVSATKNPDWSKIKTVSIKVKAGEGFYAAIRAAGWPKGGKDDALIINKVKNDFKDVLTKDGKWTDEVDATIEIPSYESYKSKGKSTAGSESAAAKEKAKRAEKISEHYYETNPSVNYASILEVYDENALLRDKSGKIITDEKGVNKTIPKGTKIHIVRFGYYEGNSEMIAEVQHATTGQLLGWTNVENLESRSFMMVSDFRSQMGGKQPARITGKAGCRQGASDMLITHLGDKDQCLL